MYHGFSLRASFSALEYLISLGILLFLQWEDLWEDFPFRLLGLFEPYTEEPNEEEGGELEESEQGDESELEELELTSANLLLIFLFFSFMEASFFCKAFSFFFSFYLLAFSYFFFSLIFNFLLASLSNKTLYCFLLFSSDDQLDSSEESSLQSLSTWVAISSRRMLFPEVYDSTPANVYLKEIFLAASNLPSVHVGEDDPHLSI